MEKERNDWLQGVFLTTVRENLICPDASPTAYAFFSDKSIPPDSNQCVSGAHDYCGEYQKQYDEKVSLQDELNLFLDFWGIPWEDMTARSYRLWFKHENVVIAVRL